MPYRCTVEKRHANSAEDWTNVYILNVATKAAAVAAIPAIVAAERPLYPPDIQITKARVDDMQAGTDTFETVIQNLAGTRAVPTSQRLPFWVTARVDFSVAGGGRPSRKYIRGMLYESDAEFTTMQAGALSELQTYATAIAAIAEVSDPDMQDIVGGAPFGQPQMRQLRRGSKKTNTP